MARAKIYHSWPEAIRLAFLDLMTVLLCGLLATALNGYSIESCHITLLEGFFFILCLMGCLDIIGGYEINRNMSTLRYASEHVLAMCVMLVIVFIAIYGFLSYNEAVKPGRSVLLLTPILATPLTLLYRYHFSFKKTQFGEPRVFYVIGSTECASQLQTIFQKAKYSHPLRFIHMTEGKNFRTEMEDFDESREGRDCSLRETISKKLKECDGVIIDLSESELDAELAELLLAVDLHSTPVYPVELFIETYFYKIYLTHVSLADALNGTFTGDHQKAYGRLKSFIDGLLAACLLLATLPLMLLIALIIKLEDFGPVFYTQERMGRFEEPFILYKFRTMSFRRDSDSELYTATGDSRITRVGRILRLFRLDELPQLWNVVMGEMSIIGPRAEWSKLVSQYEQQIPFYHLRHLVKPGITGWAQVNYGYGASLDDTIEKLQYDLYYIKHFSPHLDASIVLKTIFTMLSASGR